MWISESEPGLTCTDPEPVETKISGEALTERRRSKSAAWAATVRAEEITRVRRAIAEKDIQ